jgi:UDP-N-acetylenolpyruvoylglucosamine reductase
VTAPPPTLPLPPGVERDVPLARFTTLGTGGPARFLARPRSEEELGTLLAWARAEGLAQATIGLGSNLLVADAGFDGLVLRLEGALAAITVAGESIQAGGGASLAAIVRRATDGGLTGIEFGCAIPGTLGGAVRMNAGAYGGEIADRLESARIVGPAGVRVGGPVELELRYRHSNVASDEVVASATLRLAAGDTELIRATVRAMQGRRSEAQPRKARTFGSVFKNPSPELSSGRAIDECGLKGHVVGGARISPKHGNFIENVGGASSADVVALMVEARRRVRERFGVDLAHEVQLLGPISIPD